MKSLIYRILSIAIVLSVSACGEDTFFVEPEEVPQGAIVIDFASGATTSRAADNAMEFAVEHIDVFIFNDAETDAAKTTFHYERVAINNSATDNGRLTLGKERNEFVENAKYWVYMVANSTASVESMASIASIEGLRSLTQVDPNIHLTGLTQLETLGEHIPTHFLMDGIAYVYFNGAPNERPDGVGEATTPARPSAIVLNDGVATNTTMLKVLLSRAAAKVHLEIAPGDNVIFDKNITGSRTGYYLRNMPYRTMAIAEAVDNFGDLSKLRTPTKLNSDYFVWKEDGTLELTMYLYSHAWKEFNYFENGTSLIIDIPMHYNANGIRNADNSMKGSDEGTRTNAKNYYQILLKQMPENPDDDITFKRNTFYKASVVINAPGAEEDGMAEEISPKLYEAIPWRELTVDVNGTNGPRYLKVNRDTLKMYNIAEDLSTVLYSSSSAITNVTIRDAYYYDKYGDKTSVNNQTLNQMSASALGALSGNVGVVSPVPENNEIRYFTVELTNADGLTETIFVEQYPVIYVTNELGHYSYRSDFGNTYYGHKGNPNRSAASWNNNGTWNYYAQASNSYFFGSKVALQSGSSYTINYAYYRDSGTTQRTSRIDGLNNPRMYHVHVTSTSAEYVVGIPRLDADGFTESSADNARLVSPSFMIASQLGATLAPSGIDQAKRHCREYIEVTSDGKIYDDWRIPTSAEIDIIISNQDTSNAIDVVLSGPYYYCAYNPDTGGYTRATGKSGTQTAVRCVRDAYSR